MYAVARGRQCGLFDDWGTCQKQVSKFPGALFKSFANRLDAEQWMQENSGGGGAAAGAMSSTHTPARVLRTSSLPPPSLSKRNKTMPRTSITFPRDFPVHLENEEMVSVYTDGSCLGNGRTGLKSAGIGVFFAPNDPRNASEPLRYPGELTNQRAEIAAAIRALQIIRDHERDLECKEARQRRRHVEIVTDSKYVINAMQSWIFSWERNDWRGSNGKDVMNMDLFSVLIDLVQERFDRDGSCVKWTHVAGHEGHYGNTEADALAVAGSRAHESEQRTRSL